MPIYNAETGEYDETPEERRKREEPAAGENPSFLSQVGQGLQAGLQNRLNTATQAFTNPQQAVIDRVSGAAGIPVQQQATAPVAPQDLANTEVQSQKIKTYGDGSQEHTVTTQVPAQQTQTAPAPVAQAVAPTAVPAPAPAPVAQAVAPTPVPAPAPVAQAVTAPVNPLAAQPQLAPPGAGASAEGTAGEAQAQANMQTGMNPFQLIAQQKLAPPGAGASSEGNAGEAQAQANMQQQQQQEQQVPKTQDDIHHDAIINTRNETDPAKRLDAYAGLLADKTVSPDNKALAQRFIAEDYMKERDKAEAIKKIDEATPNDLARYMREKSGKEGSLVKAILYARLGLTDLAQKEQDLISPTTRTGAELLDGKRYTVERNREGDIVKAFNAQGKSADQSELAQLSANSVGKIAAAKPGAEYKGPNGEIGRVVTINKPNGMTETYIESNGTRVSPEDAKSWKPTSLVNAGVKSEKTTEETIKRQTNQTTEMGNRNETSAQITQSHAGSTAFNKAAGSAAGRLGTELGTTVPFAQMGTGAVVNRPPVSGNAPSPVAPGAQATAPGINVAPPGVPTGNGSNNGPLPTTMPSQANVPGTPPAYNSALSPMQNKEIQKNWGAENKKILTDFSPGGAAGKQIVAITTATNHINDDLKPLVGALKLGDYKTANAIAQKFDIWSGGADVTNFNFVAHAVADEVSKTLTSGGVGASRDRQAQEAHFASIASKQGLDGVIKEAERVMAGKTESLEAQYKRSGRRDFYTNVVSDPRVKAVVDQIRADRNVTSGQAPQGTIKIGAHWKEVQ